MTNFQMRFSVYVLSICKLKLALMKRENSREYFESNLKVFHPLFGEVLGVSKSTNFPTYFPTYVIYSLVSEEKICAF